VIVVSDSSLLITLARAHHIELLHEFYAEIAIPRQVYEEATVAGAGLPGAEEVRSASWIRVHPDSSESPEAVKAACAGLGRGEQSAFYLAWALGAGLVVIDEERARRAAKTEGLAVVGAIAILERGARLKRLPTFWGWDSGN
jgi:uncharacterized protein